MQRAREIDGERGREQSRESFFFIRTDDGRTRVREIIKVSKERGFRQERRGRLERCLEQRRGARGDTGSVEGLVVTLVRLIEVQGGRCRMGRS